VEGEFNGSALMMVCRAVHADLAEWLASGRDGGGLCPVFTLSYVESKLSVVGAVSEVDVNFADVGCAVDKKVGGSG
jgi:hypothetical protein